MAETVTTLEQRNEQPVPCGACGTPAKYIEDVACIGSPEGRTEFTVTQARYCCPASDCGVGGPIRKARIGALRAWNRMWDGPNQLLRDSEAKDKPAEASMPAGALAEMRANALQTLKSAVESVADGDHLMVRHVEADRLTLLIEASAFRALVDTASLPGEAEAKSGDGTETNSPASTPAPDELGRIAFETAMATWPSDGPRPFGVTRPTWEERGDDVKASWTAAALAVADVVKTEAATPAYALGFAHGLRDGCPGLDAFEKHGGDFQRGFDDARDVKGDMPPDEQINPVVAIKDEDGSIHALIPRSTLHDLFAAARSSEHYRKAAIKIGHDIEQTLGRALGYPKYSDDLKAFPDAADSHDVCVGEHTAGSLADEAAERIGKLESEKAVKAAAPPKVGPATNDVRSQIMALADLKPGWFDGEGETFDAGQLAAAADLLDRLAKLGVGHVYPTPMGRVRVESTNDSIEIDPTTLAARLHLYDIDTDEAIVGEIAPESLLRSVQVGPATKRVIGILKKVAAATSPGGALHIEDPVHGARAGLLMADLIAFFRECGLPDGGLR